MKRAQDKTERFNQVEKKLEAMLPPERFLHSKRVAETARLLARHYRANEEKVALAALLHDCSRFLTAPQMLEKALELKFEIDPVQRVQPKLLHADLSAHYAKEVFGITDPETLSAIRSHTVGNKNMSLTDKVVYLSDHIEEGRDYPEFQKIKTLAFTNLTQAVIESLNATIKFVESRGLPVCQKTIENRDSLKNG